MKKISLRFLFSAMSCIVFLAMLHSCTTPKSALADKKMYTGDNPEYRNKFQVTYAEGEKPVRYGYYYVVTTIPEGFKVYVFHPEKKTLTEEKIYSTSALTLLHGFYKSWWDDGSIREQGSYQFGRKHGVWLEIEPNKGKSASGEYFNHQKDGLWTHLDTSGMVESVYNWRDGKRHGKFFLYDGAGNQVNEGIYQNDILLAVLFKLPVMTKAYLKSCADELVPDVFECTDNVLKAFVYSELKYPSGAKQNDIEGQVFAQWDVDTDGSVKNIRVPQSLSEDIEKEVLRVLEKLPGWMPATKDGVPVKSTVSMPLNFSL